MNQEYLDIVDDNDMIIGRAKRSIIYAKKYSHRIVHVLLFNKKGEMALQLRSKHKSFCPGHWSTAVGGHVVSGEDWEAGALREFEEELGTICPIEFAFKDLYDDPFNPGMRKYLSTYTATYEGPFTLNPEEVDEVRFFSLKTLQLLMKKGEKFHPELKFILQRHYLNSL